MAPPSDHYHVKFFDSRKALFSSIMDIIGIGDHIFLSGDKLKKTPLWHTITQGTILNYNKQTQQLKLDFLQEELFNDTKQRIKIRTTKTKEGKIKLSYHHGFRIDQERVFTNIPGLVKRYNLGIHPSSYALALENMSENPSQDFLKIIQPGDYVTVWSVPDHNQKDFLHYPVQGWLWSKNEETKEIEFIHPPRMDIQKFSCAPQNKMMGYGFYRKLVYQLSTMDVKE